MPQLVPRVMSYLLHMTCRAAVVCYRREQMCDKCATNLNTRYLKNLKAKESMQLNVVRDVVCKSDV